MKTPIAAIEEVGSRVRVCFTPQPSVPFRRNNVQQGAGVISRMEVP